MSVSERERPFFLSGVAEAPCVFAVCDGMGGEDCGEVASLTAVETLAEHSRDILAKETDRAVYDFVTDANRKLCAIMTKQSLRMGTTLVMARIDDEAFKLYNLGDSRGYRVEGGRLVRSTDDHTMAEDKVRMGLITPAKAEKDRDRHVLTRYLGVFDDEMTAAPDVNGPYYFDKNRKILLCSDGLTEMLDYSEIAAIMTKPCEVSETVNSLIEAALAHGGRDNVTCVVIEILKGD